MPTTERPTGALSATEVDVLDMARLCAGSGLFGARQKVYQLRKKYLGTELGDLLTVICVDYNIPYGIDTYSIPFDDRDHVARGEVLGRMLAIARDGAKAQKDFEFLAVCMVDGHRPDTILRLAYKLSEDEPEAILLFAEYLIAEGLLGYRECGSALFRMVRTRLVP